MSLLFARLRLRVHETLRLFSNSFLRRSVRGFSKNLMAIWRWDLKGDTPGHQTSGKQLRVIYLLEEFVLTGGVYSVVQLVNELNKIGVDARIAFLYRSFESLNWQLETEPMFFSSWNQLLRDIPECDVVVATYWTTAVWAQRLQLSHKAKTSAYYIQDYEAWFYQENQQEQRQSVVHSYSFVQNRILKSDWLQKKLAALGHSSSKVHLGLDLGIFHSVKRKPAKGRAIRILAMARPETPRRGFPVLIKAIARAIDLGAPIEVTLFGSNHLSKKRIPFSYTDKGVIDQMECLAEMYRSHDIFLECSHFQGFGRISMEAMACGCACVLTSRGGVQEYAKDNHNCLLADPGDSEALANAILRLALDCDIRTHLSENAIHTAADFDKRKEASETYKLFVNWMTPPQVK